jgi:hypothetical protein
LVTAWAAADRYGRVIHYHELDPLYWSIADIIDSILPNLGDPGLFPLPLSAEE